MFGNLINLIVLNLSSWLMIYTLFPCSLNFASMLIQPSHGIWIKLMLPLIILWKSHSILNYTMNNGLLNQFKLLHPLLLINMTLCNFLRTSLLHFLLYWVGFYKEKNLPKPLLEKEDYSLSSTPSPLILHNSLPDFDCLFFIRYTPEKTLKKCWFLV